MNKPSKTAEQYWEKVLSDHNLGMERGRAGKNKHGERRLVAVGDGADLKRIVDQKILKWTGRVTPKGAGPDK